MRRQDVPDNFKENKVSRTGSSLESLLHHVRTAHDGPPVSVEIDVQLGMLRLERIHHTKYLGQCEIRIVHIQNQDIHFHSSSDIPAGIAVTD